MKKATTILLAIVLLVGMAMPAYAATPFTRRIKEVDSFGPALLYTDNNGVLWGCGSSAYGKLGFPNFQQGPTKILGNVAYFDVDSLNCVAAITKDSKLYTWGSGYWYSLGHGDTADRTTPTYLMDNVRQVSVGQQYMVAVKNDNTLWVWGGYGFGGPNTLPGVKDRMSTKPIKMMDNVKSVSARKTLLILKNDDTVWIMGPGAAKEAGDPEGYGYWDTPYFVTDNAKGISHGSTGILVVKNDDSIWCTFDVANGGARAVRGQPNLTKVAENAVSQWRLMNDGGLVLKKNGKLYQTAYYDKYANYVGMDPLSLKLPLLMEDVVDISDISGRYIMTGDGSIWVHGAASTLPIGFPNRDDFNAALKNGKIALTPKDEWGRRIFAKPVKILNGN